tara:strand:+ start:1318 stop:1722 length:405 start_codon:yes stop_codon:yes gene_type:complete
MRITALLTILCWMVVFVGCPKKDTIYTHQSTSLDSLFSLGDSAIKVLNKQKTKDQCFKDSLHKTLSSLSEQTQTQIQGYEVQLQQKEIRKATIKDTTIYTYKYDTIYNHVQVTVLDTVHRDTVVYRSIFKRKLF